jgi:hypothetical protein
MKVRIQMHKCTMKLRSRQNISINLTIVQRLHQLKLIVYFLRTRISIPFFEQVQIYELFKAGQKAIYIDMFCLDLNFIVHLCIWILTFIHNSLDFGRNLIKWTHSAKIIDESGQATNELFKAGQKAIYLIKCKRK